GLGSSCIVLTPRPPGSSLFPYTTLFRSGRRVTAVRADLCIGCALCVTLGNPTAPQVREFGCPVDYDAINMMPYELVIKALEDSEDRKSTRLNYSHLGISYAVFCLKKKNT